MNTSDRCKWWEKKHEIPQTNVDPSQTLNRRKREEEREQEEVGQLTGEREREQGEVGQLTGERESKRKWDS